MKNLKKYISSFLFLGVLPVFLVALFFFLKMGLLILCLYAFFFLVIISRVMVGLWLKPLDVKRELSGDVVSIGQSVQVILKIRNPHFWPVFWAYVEETLPQNMPLEGVSKRLLFLPPKHVFHLYYSVKINKRGCHALGPLVVETGDLFGLFRKTRVDKKRDFVTAVPEYSVIEEYQVGQNRWLGDYTAERSIFDDPSRIRGVREYRRGDALKRIHWKSSARAGRLYTKVFDPVMEASATVVLDFHKDSWKGARPDQKGQMASEVAVQTACSICRYLWDGGWKVGFFSNGRDPLGIPGITIAQARASDSFSEALHAARMGWKDESLAPISIRARRFQDQFQIIHENLGRIEISDGLPIETLLFEELPYIERQQVIVVLTGVITDSFISGMLRVRALGYRMMIFVINNAIAQDVAFDAFVPHGIEVYNLEHERRLKEVATGRRFL
ncbi:DUF58 domain-containing protein [Candidatus Sumerlaeota bacterium]|nr:DUF58 domain-containing protein [Candidatus Sumerlaeota bacterium]